MIAAAAATPATPWPLAVLAAVIEITAAAMALAAAGWLLRWGFRGRR